MDILICDDNSACAADIKKHIKAEEQFTHSKISCFYSMKHFLEFAASCNLQNATAILDIMLDTGKEGIALAVELNRKYPWLPIIFLTAYPHYAEDVYLSEFTCFLTKPIDSKKLIIALERAQEKLQNGRILFHLRGSDLIMCKNQISYIERIKRTSYIHKIRDDGQEVLEVSDSLDSILMRLYSHQFVHCHKSFVVNLSQVTALTSKEILLSSKERVPISRAFYPKVREALADYLGGVLV